MLPMLVFIGIMVGIVVLARRTPIRFRKKVAWFVSITFAVLGLYVVLTSNTLRGIAVEAPITIGLAIAIYFLIASRVRLSEKKKDKP